MANLELVIEGRRATSTGQAAEVRQAAGLSQADVAKVLGVTTSAVCRWERGQRTPRADVAAAYARLLRRL